MEISRDRIGSDGQFETALVDYEIENMTDECRQLIKYASAPAKRSEIGGLLQAVSQAMPHQGDQTTAESWLEITWMAVDDMPADVIREAVKNLVRQLDWRPTPAQIRDQCDWVGRKRLALKRAAS